MVKIDGKKTVNIVFIGLLVTVLALYALIIVAMFVWAGYTSFKSSIAYSFSSYGLPEKWIIDNYTIAFRDLVIPISATKNVNIMEMILYSLLYTFGATLVSTVTPCMVSYCVAKYKYRFGKVIYFIVIMVMTLPIVGGQVSELAILHTLGLYDNFLGVFILKFNFLGLAFLIFYAAFKSVSDTYVEAAHIDGASDFTVFFRIMFPLVINTFSVLLILNAIGFWNDITTSRIYLPSYPTFAYGILYFSTTPGALPLSSAGVPVRIAACMILVIPMLLIYVSFHKKLLGSLTMGGIKG